MKAQRKSRSKAKAETKPKAKPKTKPKTIDDYLASLSNDKRAALQKLRRTILTILPGAEECISYQMPAFRLDGKVIVWFGAGANHCSFFPGAEVQGYLDELGEYETSKGTVRFQPDNPLPAPLVRKLVNARLASVGAKRARSARTTSGRR